MNKNVYVRIILKVIEICLSCVLILNFPSTLDQSCLVDVSVPHYFVHLQIFEHLSQDTWPTCAFNKTLSGFEILIDLRLLFLLSESN